MTNEEKILDILASLTPRLDSIDSRLDSMDARFDAMDNRLDSMDARFDAMDNRLDSMDARFDAVDTQLASVDNRLVKLDFKIETDIETRLDALAEGHAAILEQLIPRTRVDELEGRVKVLESLIYRMNDELVQLKKAQ